jgi:hypothetical protein
MQDRDENAPKRLFLFYTQMKIERKYEKKNEILHNRNKN